MARLQLVSICLIALLIPVFIGCATGYHERRFTGGYSVFPMGDARYQVKVEYNAVTSQKKRAGIGLLRAAELARTNGYEAFKVISRSDLTSSSFVMTQSSGNTVIGGSTSTPYGYVMVIQLTNDSEAISADSVIAEYGPEFHRYKKK